MGSGTSKRRSKTACWFGCEHVHCDNDEKCKTKKIEDLMNKKLKIQMKGNNKVVPVDGSEYAPVIALGKVTSLRKMKTSVEKPKTSGLVATIKPQLLNPEVTEEQSMSKYNIFWLDEKDDVKELIDQFKNIDRDCIEADRK